MEVASAVPAVIVVGSARRVENRVSIDQELCIGTADCVRTAPDIFKLDESDGRVALRRGILAADLMVVQKAARECPTQAIIVEPNVPSRGARPGALRPKVQRER